METKKALTRRHLLVGAASAGAALGFGVPVRGRAQAAPSSTPVKALPASLGWKDADSLIVHSPNTIETRRTAFGADVLTPAERLFVRNNINPPDPAALADREGWSLSVEGVRQPRKLTVAELKQLGLETVVAVLQCSGNGRAYFESKPSGTPWTVGAAGCLAWSGVPVRTVADALGGVAKDARYITGTGGEPLPPGIDPQALIVERSVPIDALDDALLAWEMNGKPIPHAHGGPLRLIHPGYSGVNNIKYVRRLAFTREETSAAIQRTRYRVHPPDTEGDPRFPAVWEMDPKSWIVSPAPEAGPIRAGQVQVSGFAMGGMRAPRRVEVSTDAGRSWREARLIGPDLGRFAWRTFVFAAQLSAGRHTLASRVTDTRGRVQVEHTADNAGGYLNSGWRAHAVEVTVA